MKRVGLIMFGDLLTFWVSFLILILIRFQETSYQAAISEHIIPFLILCLCWILIFYVFGLYDLVFIKPTIPYLKRWVLVLISSFFVGMVLFYFIPALGITPKTNLLIQVTIFGIFSFLLRRIIYALFAKAITRPAILVGDSSYLLELEKTIIANPQIGLRIIGHFSSIDYISIKLEDIKNVVIILDRNKENSTENILNFYEKGADIIDTAKAYEKYLFKIPVEYIDLPFIVEKISNKKDILYNFTTIILNISLALITLLITSPLLVLAILARFVEDGRPIFIKQKRVGLNGKIFNLYKLRSMVVLCPDGSAEKNGAVWETSSNDPRITKVGRIMRKLHIDEIPQMINIIKGDLSLVGPRAERPEFVNLLNKDIPYYSFRHIIRPGFTGWAQIKYHYARTVDESKEKFEYDLYYIKNRNIFLDFGIILRTIQIIFTH